MAEVPDYPGDVLTQLVLRSAAISARASDDTVALAPSHLGEASAGTDNPFEEVQLRALDLARAARRVSEEALRGLESHREKDGE